MDFVTVLLAQVSAIDASKIFGLFNNGIVNITVVSLLVSQILKKKLKPIEKDVETAKLFMEKHDETLNQLFDNESFNKTLERTIESHVLFLGKDGKYQDARTYIVYIGSLVKTFACDILLIGVNDASNDIIKSKASTHIISAKQKCATLFGIKWTEKYYKKYGEITNKYINDVCHISEDLTNDKQMRFRTITMAYIQMVMSNFVREYLQEYKNYENN